MARLVPAVRALVVSSTAALPACDDTLGADFDDTRSVRVTITQPENPLDPSATGHGSFSVNGETVLCDTTCSEAVAPNAVATLRPIADPGSAFHSWRPVEACATGGQEECGIEVLLEDREIEAYFVKDLTNLWAKSVGGSPYLGATAVTADAAGNVIVAGTFQEHASFAGQELEGYGDIDMFVVKYDSWGSPLAALGFGSSGGEGVQGVTPLADGGILVVADVASFPGSVPIFVGQDELPTASDGGGTDALVLGLDASFAVRGAWHARGTESQALTAVAASPDAVLAVGWVGGSIETTDGSSLVSDDADVLIAKLEPTGQLSGLELIGGPGKQHASACVAGPDGTFYVSGSFETVADLGGSCQPLSAPKAEQYHGFVARFDAQGRCLSARRIVSGDELAGVQFLAVDASGSVYVQGMFAGGVDLSAGTDPNGELPLKYPYQSYAAKLGPDLEWVVGSSWVVRAGPDVVPTAMKADGAGNLLLAASQTGVWSEAPEWFSDIVLTKLDSQGNELLTRRFGGRSSESVRAVAWDATTHTWLIAGEHGDGIFADPIDFGGVAENPLMFQGGVSALIAKFSP